MVKVMPPRPPGTFVIINLTCLSQSQHYMVGAFLVMNYQIVNLKDINKPQVEFVEKVFYFFFHKTVSKDE